MLVREWEAKYIYFDKQELEQALGVDLDVLPVRKLPLKQERVTDKNLIKPKTTNTEKDSTIAELQTENEQLKARIAELENQLQAQQSAVNSQEVLPVNNLDESYNPTERETHLLMIDAMAKLLTNQNFNVNKYIRGKNINKKQISEDITEHITKVLNTPETKPRSLETIRKRLDEALKLNEQAD
ncbi:Uncharacterised protein [Rodentibacter pneumotropicus]|uniref:Uncharacterized protein n=1 Tax=Rodentibacter pneumotropicus TaxID=758 RepID=A0A3S4XVV5_9PAST|nr:Uncharacterised protein [Rodentibacter pneumotropicus]